MIGHFYLQHELSFPRSVGGGTVPDRAAAGKDDLFEALAVLPWRCRTEVKPCRCSICARAGLGPEEARREDPRRGRRRRRHGRVLGPGQISPYHRHPDATEIYFCFEGGGTMRTPHETIAIVPGSFVVHPPGELH